MSEPAQARTPFTCTGDLYQVQSGQLRIFDTASSTYTDIGPQNSGYNSLAHNPRDNYFYATQSQSIIRIDASGTIEVVFSIGFNSYLGDIDNDNNIYLRRNNTTMVRINITDRSQTNITLSQPLPAGTADWAFVETANGLRLIGVGRSAISVINTQTGQNATQSISGFPNEGSTGAVWADVNGRIFAFRNRTGNVYEIFDYLTSQPRAELVAVGDPSNSNDGASCRTRPFPNFPPIAFDDEYSTAFQTLLNGVNVISGSGNGVDNDPDGTPVTVNPDLIEAPAHGLVEIGANGDFTYRPDENFSGIDTFIYEIRDASGLTAQATVTITVTKPVIEIRKSSISLSSGREAGFHLPGTAVQYDIVLSNTGNQQVDKDSLFLVDVWPSEIAFKNGGAGPSSSVSWVDTDSGLSFDPALDVSYSDAATRPEKPEDCSYQPKGATDTNVRFICIVPRGSLQPAGSARFTMLGEIL